MQAFFQKNPRFVGRAALPTSTALDDRNVKTEEPTNTNLRHSEGEARGNLQLDAPDLEVQLF